MKKRKIPKSKTVMRQFALTEDIHIIFEALGELRKHPAVATYIALVKFVELSKKIKD